MEVVKVGRTDSMKLRFVFMGCIVTLTGALLIVARGAATI
jgi:hypothetical protein